MRSRRALLCRLRRSLASEAKRRGQQQCSEVDDSPGPKHVAGKMGAGDHAGQADDRAAAQPEQQGSGGQPRPAAIADECRRHQVEAHCGVAAGKRRVLHPKRSLPHRHEIAGWITRIVARLEGLDGVRTRPAPTGLQHAIDQDARPDDQHQREEQTGVAPGFNFHPEKTDDPNDDPATPYQKCRIDSPVVKQFPRLLRSQRKAGCDVGGRSVARKEEPDRRLIEIGRPEQYRRRRQERRGGPNGGMGHWGEQS